MHEHGGHDSLVYWLEFKNDEEFPGVRGLAASPVAAPSSSACTSGTRLRLWMTGSPQKQREITVPEAVECPGDDRDQMLAGVELLERCQSPADDERT